MSSVNKQCPTIDNSGHASLTTAKKFRAVILPGLDGTGRLLEHFKQALSSYVTVTVIAYPGDELLSYDQLLSYVKARLPDEDFILVGESFSGPLALRIAAENPKIFERCGVRRFICAA